MPWMSDEAWEFTQDSIEKKITARSARSTRTHCGKSGAVKFPSDFLSKKELKKMNGECKSYRMGSPIAWDEFKTWPDEHKKTYIKLVREKYKAPDTALAEAMGVSQVTFRNWMKTLGLSQGKGAGAAGRHWYKTEDHERFIAWWNGVKLEETSIEAPETIVGTTSTHVDFYEAVRAENAAEEAAKAIEVSAPLIPELKIGYHGDLEGDTCCREQAPEKKATDENDQKKGEYCCPEPKYIPYSEMMTRKVRAASAKQATDVQQYVDKFFRNKGETEDHISTTHYMPVIPKNGTMTFANNNADDALATIKALLNNSKVVLSVSWECV